MNTIKKAEEKAAEQKTWLSVNNKQDISVSSKPKVENQEPQKTNTTSEEVKEKNKLTLAKLELLKNKMNKPKSDEN